MKSLRTSRRTYRVAEETAASDGIPEEKLREYLAMDNDARWQLLVTKVAQSRREGKLTDADLDTFAAGAKQVLDETQYARLCELIRALKS